MCRTLRGGRADAMTTRTPRAGSPTRAIAVCSLIRLESFSSVPSRSIATSPIGRACGERRPAAGASAAAPLDNSW